MRNNALLLAVALAVSGCAHSVAVSKYDKQTYAPTSHVDVYHGYAPGRPFEEIATLTVDDRRHGNLEAALIEKAQEIGADGVIMLGASSGRSFMVPMGGMLLGRTIMESRATAIKYK